VIAQQIIEKKGSNHDVSLLPLSPVLARYLACVQIQSLNTVLFPSQLLRTARLSFYGGESSFFFTTYAPLTRQPERSGAIFGPLVVNWYQLLNRLQFTSPRKAVVYRTFLDQAVFSPRKSLPDFQADHVFMGVLAMVALFFTAMPLMEGSGVDAARQKVSEVNHFRLFYVNKSLKQGDRRMRRRYCATGPSSYRFRLLTLL
jgi:hypothetical protein